MISIVAGFVKYIMIILVAVYTFQSFTVFKHNSGKRQKRIYRRQNRIMIMSHFAGYVVIMLENASLEMCIFYAAQVVYLIATVLVFNFIYPKASRLIVNNMCMLLSMGFVILGRLSFDNAKKQFMIAVVSTVIALLVPVIIRKLKFLKNIPWLYCGLGIVMIAVLLLMERVNGANIELRITDSIAINPTEFVKIIFVFFVAAMLYKTNDFRQVVITTVFAGMHVLLLVMAKDLGPALIFFMAFLVMLYVACQNVWYLLGGLAGGSLASVVAYFLFAHVRERVIVWRDPFDVDIYYNSGYQVAQSLFAIGTGGWFGTGLYQGAPQTIPLAETDFVFSAISEELGGIYAICLIMICMSCFLMFVNISLQMKDKFYKLIALGLGTVYAFQVFLTIGGGIKFIPSTGVTLPFISYGGSSVLSTFIMFAIIQGLYILREDEEENLERQRADSKSKDKGRKKEKEEPVSKKKRRQRW